MQWSKDASEAIRKVPFFVRKRVKARVEEEAVRSGYDVVTLKHVKACQRKFLSKMEDEVKGFQVEACFGATGCPNRAVSVQGLAEQLEKILGKKNIKEFLKAEVKGPLKIHHEFRVSISDCPNACSRPQIVDLGLIGASKPGVGKEPCTRCEACVEACKESAVSLGEEGPVIDFGKCLFCGACIRDCPTGTIQEKKTGFRVLVGGKLGRHPKLAQDLGQIFAAESIPSVVGLVADFYKSRSTGGERLGAVMERSRVEELMEKMKKAGLLT